jgi:hypothetical protein
VVVVVVVVVVAVALGKLNREHKHLPSYANVNMNIPSMSKLNYFLFGKKLLHRFAYLIIPHTTWKIRTVAISEIAG